MVLALACSLAIGAIAQCGFAAHEVAASDALVWRRGIEECRGSTGVEREEQSNAPVVRGS
jgi:hypothetical protein